MTEAQRETLRFYTTNDYLLINGLLWCEDEEKIDAFIHLINDDGRAVLAEAIAEGFDVRWKCSKEEGARLFQIYQKRFPVIDSQDVVDKILAQAQLDIAHMHACMMPLPSDLVLYRNFKTRYVENLELGMTLNHLGFSSCSLNPHIAENATYGAGGCTLVEILAPAGTPAIRLDLMEDVRNEPDEVILAPITYLVTKIDNENGKIYMACK